jgi:hypothetical protein
MSSLAELFYPTRNLPLGPFIPSPTSGDARHNKEVGNGLQILSNDGHLLLCAVGFTRASLLAELAIENRSIN